MKTIDFIKMHGLGNDFVILDERCQLVENKEELSKKAGSRHFGVGCDQIIFIEKSDGADAFMRIYNPDGSESGACGNATRCVADIILKETKTQTCVIETISGLLNCTRVEKGLICVDMGVPKLEWSQIPLSKESNTLSLSMGGNGVSNPVAVNMGNPHCVFFVGDVDAVDIAKLGRQFEYDPLFPERTNVEFVEVIDRNHIRMRVWERGAGVTLACGSGSCAAAVAAIRRNLTARKITVSMDGGDLMINWDQKSNRVTMIGPVTYVFHGTFNLEQNEESHLV
jgi:diaminopimelate epimerase